MPGVFQITKGWSTTDVESIVGNWDEFIDACKHKTISIRMYGATTNGNPIISDCFVVPYMGSEFYPEHPVMLSTPIDGVKWRGDTIEANKVYQASIVRGIGILVGRDIA